MTVEVYICEKFQYGHERRAFGRFLQEMIDRYQESDDLYLIIVEPEANTAAMDLIILTPRALIVAELKDLSKAMGVDPTEIGLIATENGSWEYRLEDGSTRVMGSVYKRNPYQQVKNHRFKLRDWLKSHSDYLPGGPWRSIHDIHKIYSWIVVSPGYNPDLSNIDLPWKEIGDWFKLLSIEKLAWEVHTAVNNKLEFTADHMRSLVKRLGGIKRENLSEFVPNYVPPSPPLSFFSKPHIPKYIVDRDTEREELLNHLDDPNVSIITLGGPGGIGKTYLAAFYINAAMKRGINGLWIDCREREVTSESFLAAIADKIPDRYQAALIHDPDQRITDKFELALNFLDKEKHLIVLNDYHLVSDDRSLDQFFTHVIQKSENIKVLLTTRVRPNCLDNPKWPPGSSVELNLAGLPLTFIPDYLQVRNLTNDQLESISNLTSGNPYALKLLSILMQKRSWEDEIENLPLFNDYQANYWAEPLFETLDGDVRSLAGKIAVIRTTLSVELIQKLAYTSYDQTVSMIDQLVNSYVLEEVGFKLFQMHYYIRNAFLANIDPKNLQKAHRTAGSYYEQIAEQLDNTTERIEAILHCLYHYEKAQNWHGVLTQAGAAYELLLRRGDKDRCLSVSEKAVKAAKAENAKPQIVTWLTRVISKEIDLEKPDEAERHINEAFTLIPKNEEDQSAEKGKQWKALETSLWIEKGRRAFIVSDLNNMGVYFKNGLELAWQTGDLDLLANSLLMVGRYERYRGNYENAKKYLVYARGLSDKLNDHHLAAMCNTQLGLIARKNGDLDMAKRLFQKAIEMDKLADDFYGAEINSGLLGDIALRSGEFETAEKIFRKRLEQARPMNNGKTIRITLGWLAEALIGMGKLDEAAAILDECDRKSDEAEDGISIAWVLKRKGQLEQARGNIIGGNVLIQQGIEKLEEINDIKYIDDFKKAILPTQTES